MITDDLEVVPCSRRLGAIGVIRPSLLIPPTMLAYLIDQVVAFFPDAPKAFHREGGEFVAALTLKDIVDCTHFPGRAYSHERACRSKGPEAADPSRSAPPVCMWTPALVDPHAYIDT